VERTQRTGRRLVQQSHQSGDASDIHHRRHLCVTAVGERYPTDQHIRRDDHGLSGTAESASGNQPWTEPEPIAGSYVYLNGSASDDGLPTGSHLTVTWTQLSGPAPVTIFQPNSPGTTILTPLAGVYVLQLSGNDTQLTTNASVTVTALPPANQPPNVYTGYYPPIQLPTNSINLTGQVTDDGLPSGTLVSAWSQVNGPAR